MQKILIIDDNPANLSILFHLLEKEGFNPLVAASGEEGIRTAQASRPDLILLDILMEGIDGFKTLEYLKKDSEVSEIPVIFITALSDTEYVVKGLSMGAVDFIKKPFRKEEVLARIRTQLSLREKIEADMERKKMETIMRLTGGIAHEFNNKLHVINGNLEMLKEDYPEDSAAHEYAAAIDQAAGKLIHLTNQLITCSGFLPPEPVHLLLGAFMEEETLPIIGHGVPSGIKIDWNFPKEDVWVRIDQNQVQMVISEIVTNACEAMEENGLLRIALVTKDSPELLPPGILFPDKEPSAGLIFSDTGSGMDPEALEKVFDPFFTTKFQGRGMGMSVVQGIVRKHRGQIRLFSEKGKGTTVMLFFPLADPDKR